MEKLVKDFISEQTTGMNLYINIFIFMVSFISNVAYMGIFGALLKAAFVTIVLAVIWRILAPIINPILEGLFRK